jgi:hypothetical protein
LNDANLAIYPVDARGLVASASARVSSRVYQNRGTMEELASRTAFTRKTTSSTIHFHNLKVKMVELPHLELRYRKGYMDQSTPPQDEGLRRAAAGRPEIDSTRSTR